MELWQIRYFLAVAEKRSISAAALTLNISQPPLSRQIRAMEEEAGLPLFLRKNSGLELTEAGLFLQKRGKELLEYYEGMISGLKSVALKEKNRIIFGSNDGGSILMLPICSNLYKRKFEYAEVISYIKSTEEILEGVANGSIDIGFIRIPFPDMQQYDIIEFKKEQWVALTALDYPGASNWKKRVTVRELGRHPLIMPSRHSLYLPIVKALTSKDIIPQVLSYYFELANGVALAQHKLGVAIVPSCIIDVVPKEGYHIWEIEGMNLFTCYGTIKQKGKYSTETLRKFWKILEKYSKNESFLP